MNISFSPRISFADIRAVFREKRETRDIVGDYLFTIDGRTALFIAIKTLAERTPNKKWLIPAYFCPSVHQTFIDSKVSFEYYPIGEDLQANIEYLSNKLSSDSAVGGVLFINYFGFAANTAPYRELIQRNGISVVYDCAHILFQGSSDAVCNENEAYVYSIRKWYPLPHGGVLLCRNVNRARLLLSKCSDAKLYKQLLKYSLYSAEQYLGINFRKYLLSFSAISKYVEQKDVAERYDILMHDNVIGYFKRILSSAEIIRQKHRANFHYALNYFRKNKQFIPLRTHLENSECPFVFPLMVMGLDRDFILKECLRNKIPLRIHWTPIAASIPKSTLFESSYNLANNILCLPVHNGVTEDSLGRICATINQVAARPPAVSKPGESPK